MTNNLFALILLAGILPLLAEENAQPQPPKNLAQPELTPFFQIPDSLKNDSLRTLIIPGLTPKFYSKDGVVIIPNAEKIDPGFCIEADPTVDLGIIFPKENRQRILQRQQERKRDFRFDLIPPQKQKPEKLPEMPKDKLPKE